MLQRSLPILLFIWLILLAACRTSAEPTAAPTSTPVPASTPVGGASVLLLPNLLIKVTGKIEVRREGSAGFVPVGMGTAVQPGDILRLVDGEASVFCGNESLWQEGPKALSVGEEGSAPCLAGSTLRPKWNLSGLRGEKSTSRHELPYVLSPRGTFILNDDPLLRWQLLPDVPSYTVTLMVGEQEKATITASTSPLAYPENWPSLQADGTDYRLQVVGGERSSKEEGTQNKGFTLLSAKKASQVDDYTNRLRQRVQDDPSLTLLLAELYLNNSYNLRTEAIDLLQALPNGDQIAAVQRLLGQTYLEMELFNEAAAAYQQTLTLAQADALREEEATAHVGLGVVACAQQNKKQARERWEQALELYQEMELEIWAEEVNALLAEVESKCKPRK